MSDLRTTERPPRTDPVPARRDGKIELTAERLGVMAEQGRGWLAALRDEGAAASEAGSTAAAREALVSPYVSDPVRLDAIAALSLRRPGVLDALLSEIAGTVPRAGISTIKRNAKRRAKVLKAAVKMPTAPVGALQRALRTDKASGLRCPDGWTLTLQGVSKKQRTKTGEFEDVPIAHAPIFVSAALRDEEDRSQDIELTWRSRGRWVSEIVPRGEFAAGKLIGALGAQGAPIHIGNARKLIDWIDLFENVNAGSIPERASTGRLGWHNGSFVPYTDDIEPRPNGGLEEIVETMRAEGDLAGWIDAVHAVAEYPSVQLAVLMAAAAPLVRICGAKNMIGHWVGPSGKGKSLALAAGASVFGDPRDGGYVSSWASTKVGLEREAEAHQDLPTCLDELQHLDKERELQAAARFLFMFSQGVGKGRGTRDGGTAKRPGFKGVLLSTGEISVTEATQDEGSCARVLTIRGLPFGETDRSPLDASAFEDAIGDHHAQAGPALMAYLATHPEERDELKAQYDRLRTDMRDVAPTHTEKRLAKHIALLEVTRALLSRAIGLHLGESVIERALEAAAESAADSDRGLAALRMVYGLAASLEARFYGRQSASGIALAPPQGWAGRWDSGPTEDLAIVPSVLKGWLVAEGYNRKTILDNWARRGWLRLDRDGGRTVRTTLGGSHQRVRCVVISIEAVADLI